MTGFEGPLWRRIWKRFFSSRACKKPPSYSYSSLRAALLGSFLPSCRYPFQRAAAPAAASGSAPTSATVQALGLAPSRLADLLQSSRGRSPRLTGWWAPSFANYPPILIGCVLASDRRHSAGWSSQEGRLGPVPACIAACKQTPAAQQLAASSAFAHRVIF